MHPSEIVICGGAEWSDAMQFDEQSYKDLEGSSPKNTPMFLKNNAIAIYTGLEILSRIKKQVGLEAMLEYMQNYQKLIEQHNPDFRQAVGGALAIMDVEKLYRDIAENESV